MPGPTARALTPNIINSLSPIILTNSNYALNILDVNVTACNVQVAGITLTLPQNPQIGVTSIFISSEQSFFLSGGAANPLSPSDPLPVGAGSSFTATFTAVGWQIQGQLTNLVAHNASLYGTGGDGSVTFDGVGTPVGTTKVGSTYTLTRDVNYNNATVNSGITVITAGFRFSCAGALLNNGTIQNNGTAGTSAGVAGTGGAGGTLGAGTNGGAGSVGAAGVAGTNQAATTKSTNGTNSGGAGGSNGGANAGGAGGAVQGTTTTSFAEAWAMQHGWLVQGQGLSSFTLAGGAGGGGGGSTAAGQGGGGGGGGGVCGVFAFFLTNNGVIAANGGAGGSGSTAVASGGGGGGGGGAVMVLTRVLSAAGTLPGTGTVTASGGAGGAGVAGGVAGTVGNAGTVTVLAA